MRTDGRERDRIVRNERVGLQSHLQRGQVGQRLHRRARLALGLRSPVQLAGEIGEAAGHRQNASGLVLQHQRRALHGWTHPQIRTSADGCNRAWSTASILGFADVLALDHVDIDHIIEAEIALNARARCVKREHAPVSDTDADIAITALAAALVENNGRLPMHIGKRQLHRLQSLLPRRQRARCCRGAAGTELLNRVADIGLRPAKLGAAGTHLITREPLLQGRLGLTLQRRVDGRVDSVRFCRQARDAIGLRLAA